VNDFISHITDVQYPQCRAALASRREAELITSLTSCSGKQDESAIMQFWPPVSAIKWQWRFLRLAKFKLILICAVLQVEPVNTTPAMPLFLAQLVTNLAA
jgi:hypothetical protein